MCIMLTGFGELGKLFTDIFARFITPCELGSIFNLQYSITHMSDTKQQIFMKCISVTVV